LPPFQLSGQRLFGAGGGQEPSLGARAGGFSRHPPPERPVLTVFLSLQRRADHEALRGPPHTRPELLRPREGVLPMVQKVRPGWAKAAMLSAPRAHVRKSSFVSFSPKVCEGDSCFFTKSPAFQVKSVRRLIPPHPPVQRMVSFFFCAGVQSRRDVLLQRETGICHSPKLAEVAIIPWSVPSFPRSGSVRGLRAFRRGQGW